MSEEVRSQRGFSRKDDGQWRDHLGFPVPFIKRWLTGQVKRDESANSPPSTSIGEQVSRIRDRGEPDAASEPILF